MDNGQFEHLLQEITASRRHTDETVGKLRDELLVHTAAMIADSREHTAAQIAESRQHTGMLVQDLREQTASIAQDLRRHTDETALETRRHFEVVAEGLRQDVRLVAEGLAVGNDKRERLRLDMTAEFAETRAMIKLSYSELDRRLRRLETRS